MRAEQEEQATFALGQIVESESEIRLVEIYINNQILSCYGISDDLFTWEWPK